MKEKTKYVFDYIGGLRVTLEEERGIWPPEQFTQNLCILNALETLTHEIERLDKSIAAIQPCQSCKKQEAETESSVV